MSICVALRIGAGVPVKVFLILEEIPLLSNRLAPQGTSYDVHQLPTLYPSVSDTMATKFLSSASTDECQSDRYSDNFPVDVGNFVIAFHPSGSPSNIGRRIYAIND